MLRGALKISRMYQGNAKISQGILSHYTVVYRFVNDFTRCISIQYGTIKINISYWGYLFLNQF